MSHRLVFNFLLLPIFVIFVFGTEPKKIYQFQTSPKWTGTAVLTLTVGSPPQTFDAILRSSESDLIVIDERCGLRLPSCPKYCNDTIFGPYYCPLVCQSNYGRQIQAYCGNLEHYDSSMSETANYTLEEWYEQVESFYPLYGVLVRDYMTIPNSLNTDTSLYIENFKFVSGLRMDIRFFKIILQYSNSVLGLAPGNKDNTSIPFIKQLYLNGQIEEPIISLLVKQSLTTIGGLDVQHCLTDKTVKVPNLSKTRWIVEANEFEISYLNRVEKVHFLVEPDTFLLGVPTSYIKILIQNKIIVRSDDLINYIYCNTTLIMNFKLNNHSFLLDIGKYIQTLNISEGKDLCLLPVKPTDYRYSDWPVWQLGVIFFIDYCCAFNYTDNSLVVSNYKPDLLTPTNSINL